MISSDWQRFSLENVSEKSEPELPKILVTFVEIVIKFVKDFLLRFLSILLMSISVRLHDAEPLYLMSESFMLIYHG